MNIVGFNLAKVFAQRGKLLEKPFLNTNIEFTNIEKENLELIKDSEALKVNFKCSWTYTKTNEKDAKNLAEIAFEGNIILATEKKQAKDILKEWKKNKLDQKVQVPLFNFILRKCTPRAAQLSEEVGLPSPIPLPKIRPQ